MRGKVILRFGAGFRDGASKQRSARGFLRALLMSGGAMPLLSYHYAGILQRPGVHHRLRTCATSIVISLQQLSIDLVWLMA